MRRAPRHHCHRSRLSEGPRARHGKRRISFPSQTSARPRSSRFHFCCDLVCSTRNKHRDMKFFSGTSPLESVSGPENPRPFTAVKARGAHGALRASLPPLGECVLKDQEAFPTEFHFTSGLRTTTFAAFILETRVLELHHQSVRSSDRSREASRARFPSSGCFPRHAVARRGDQLAERSPRRRATQLPSTFSHKANFFRNFAPPFPYTHLRNGNDMPLRSALTQTGTTCTATHVAWPCPLA